METAAEELSLVDITIMCKQCDETFTVIRGEQSCFAKKLMSTPARCKECRRWKWLKASEMPGGDIPKGSTESNFQDQFTSWAMKKGWWTEAREIEDKRWRRVCDRQRRQTDALGLKWEEVDPTKETDSTNVSKGEIIEHKSLALALNTKAYFTNDEWNKLKVPDTIIYKSRIKVGDRMFKPVPEERLPGQLGGDFGEDRRTGA